MVWDGLGFFGTDHMKLGRLKGEPVNFLTMFKSPKSLMLWFLTVGLFAYLIATEADKLYSPKS